MSKVLNVCASADKLFLMTWEKDDAVSYYNIVGMDNLFANHVITSTSDARMEISADELKNYIRVHIQYIFYDDKVKKEIVLDTTNDWVVESIDCKKLTIHCLESYQGYTLSFFGEGIYDRYSVYEKTENGDKFVVESEDFQIHSDQFVSGKTYYVEAYSKIDDNYKLKAKSNLYNCKVMHVAKPQKVSLSIVVPIYNSEVFLARTLDSLLFSTFKDKEIILINDGSTDNSGKIIEWYEKKYKDIVRVYSLDVHEGPSYARNIGLQYVQGDYVAFMDSDDMAHPYMYERLYTLAIENDLDVAIGKTLIRSDVNENSYCLDVKKNEGCDSVFYSFDSMFNEYRNNTYDNIFFVSVWHKILRTDIARNHPFPTFNHYEDTAYTMTAYSYANRFAFCKSAYYVWDQRFRKTVGTYTTSYQKISSTDLNNYYIDALFHTSKEGNPKRLDYLAYYSTVELYNYFTSAKFDLYNNQFLTKYTQEIKDLNKRIDLLSDKYIKENHGLFVFIANILKS